MQIKEQSWIRVGNSRNYLDHGYESKTQDYMYHLVPLKTEGLDITPDLHEFFSSFDKVEIFSPEEFCECWTVRIPAKECTIWTKEDLETNYPEKLLELLLSKVDPSIR